jgi:hypothetical protein
MRGFPFHLRLGEAPVRWFPPFDVDRSGSFYRLGKPEIARRVRLRRSTRSSDDRGFDRHREGGQAVLRDQARRLLFDHVAILLSGINRGVPLVAKCIERDQISTGRQWRRGKS